MQVRKNTIGKIILVSVALGVSWTAFGADFKKVLDRYQVVGLISQSDNKLGSGIAVIKDTQKERTIILSKGNVLDEARQFVVKEIEKGRVIIGDIENNNTQLNFISPIQEKDKEEENSVQQQLALQQEEDKLREELINQKIESMKEKRDEYPLIYNKGISLKDVPITIVPAYLDNEEEDIIDVESQMYNEQTDEYIHEGNYPHEALYFNTNQAYPIIPQSSFSQ